MKIIEDCIRGVAERFEKIIKSAEAKKAEEKKEQNK